MKIEDALQEVSRLFLDTAPVIYYVENNPHYFTIVEVVFDHIDDGSLIAVTSPVTLAESLVVPYRSGASDLQQAFFDLIVQGQNVSLCQSMRIVAENLRNFVRATISH